MTTSVWSSNRLSGFVFLLPYMDQGPVYDSINMAFSQSDAPYKCNPENDTASHTVIGALLCPSDGEPNHRCSYRFNAGDLGASAAPRSCGLRSGLGCFHARRR